MYANTLRQTIRSLRRRPAFSLATILTVALGIGVNVLVYHVIYAVLIDPLPFRDSEHLVQLWETTPGLSQIQVTVPDFVDWRKEAHSFEQIAAYSFQAMNNMTLIGVGQPATVHVTMTTHNLFSMMGIQPLLGRSYSATEEQEKRSVVMISENLWRSKFGARSGIIDKTIRLETRSFTVIGVMPDRQTFPHWADVWMPFSWLESELSTTRRYHPLEVIARLKPGVRETQAQQEIQILAERIAKDHPETNQSVGAYVVPLAKGIAGDLRPTLLLIWAAVGLVFLIASANLAHLLLARMLERQREMALRISLGANVWQVARLVLTESISLALVGGAVGAGLAAWASYLLQSFIGDNIPRMYQATFSWPVWLFSCGLSILCGILFGLPGCWQALRGHGSVEASRSFTQRRSRFNQALLSGEIALSFVVLTGVVLLVRSFIGLLTEDPGFRPRGVLAFEIPMPSSRYDWDKASGFFNTRLIPAIHNLSGVQAVAAANCAPMSLKPTERSRYSTRFGIEGKIFEVDRYPVGQIRWVTPEYFRVLGIPLKRGRWLTDADLAKPIYLVNETLARRFFPNQDPTSKRLTVGVTNSNRQLDEIAGVVGDVRDMGLDQPVLPTLYLVAASPGMTLLVRSSKDTSRLLPAIREIIHRLDPELAVMKAQPLEQYVADSLSRRRFALALLLVFGGLAIFLTAAGIYGLLAHSVNGRMRELGIRAAIGAEPKHLLRMILRESAVLTSPGLVLGIGLSLASATLMNAFAYRVSTTDPSSLLATAFFLLVVIFCSVWLPAKRAARVDPAAMLRME